MKKALWLSPLIAATVLTAGAVQSPAQIIGQIDANVPFSFYVGESKLPPGPYIIRMADPLNNSLMEIRSQNGAMSALFQVTAAQASQSPQKAEVFFKHLDNRYYLRRIFDPDDSYGVSAIDAGYYKMLKAADEAGQQKEVDATHNRKPLPSAE